MADETNSEQHIPPPGSRDALDAGCRCPVLDNGHGRGRGDGTYWISERCPLHCPEGVGK